MKKNASDCTGIVQYLGDPSCSREDREKLVGYSFGSKTEEGRAIRDYVLDAVEKVSANASSSKDEATYRERLIDLERGPARPAAFIKRINRTNGFVHDRGLVVFEDGSEAVSICTDGLAGRLKEGDSVLVDPRAGVIIAQDGNRPFGGEVATLEKPVGEEAVLVRLGNEERCVLLASSLLRQKLASGAVEPGGQLVVNVRQRMAWIDVPPDEDRLKHYRFLDRSGIPPVDMADVGAPNPIIRDVCAHVYQELTHPEIRRRFFLPRSFFALLSGSPGTGKSHSLQAIERRIYEMMSRHLHVPLADLPRRSMTLNVPSIISKYLGESDRNLAAFARECFELARVPFKGKGGKEHLLPLLVRCEEIDGIGARRSDGDFDGHSMTRVLTTLLGLFDPARVEFLESMIIFLATSNRPQGIDAALLRRTGKSYSFGRLTRRRPFEAVLAAQLKNIPLACNADPELARRQAIDEVGSWLFAEQGQDPIVDLACVGSSDAVTKLRKDFLTPALVNRAVIAAASGACARELEGMGEKGVTTAELMGAIDDQVRSIAENQLTAENVRDHLDIPDGVRVANVKRRPRPAVPKYLALRVSQSESKNM